MKNYKAIKKYEAPCMEVAYFGPVDIISTSDPDVGDNSGDEPEL